MRLVHFYSSNKNFGDTPGPRFELQHRILGHRNLRRHGLDGDRRDIRLPVSQEPLFLPGRHSMECLAQKRRPAAHRRGINEQKNAAV